MSEHVSVMRFPRAVQILVAAAAAVIVVTGMKEAAPILSSFLMALVITLALAPVPRRLMNKGVPAWLALVLTILLAIAFIVALVLFLAAALVQFANALPEYQDSFDAVVVQADDLAKGLGVNVAEIDIASFLDAGKITSFAASMVAGLLDLLSSTSLLLLLILFMLIDTLGFGDKIEQAMGADSAVLKGWALFAVDTRQYLIITAWTGALVGIVNAIVLYILGVDFALLWGVLAFLFSFIPNIGFMLSMIPPTLLALLEFGWTKALIVMAAYIIINAGVDNVLKPKVIGDDLDISVATTFISLVFWGWVLGPLGAILAVPLTLLVKHVLLGPGEDSRWLAAMMGQKARPAEGPGG